MNLEIILKIISVIIGAVLIITIAYQPSQKTGLIGDVSGVEKMKKRGFNLFLYRFTIIGIILLFTCALLYGMGIGGAF